jgi:hypothetical protein
VQHVEAAERLASAAHLLQGRLVLVAPGVRERFRVDRGAVRRQPLPHLARDRAAPVHQRAEDVEQKQPDLVHR